jgi:hypothetical protein
MANITLDYPLGKAKKGVFRSDAPQKEAISDAE